MLHENNKFYFSCAQPTSLTDSQLGINSTFGRNLGIREGDSVNVRAVFNLSVIKTLTIVTKSNEDYEIMVSIYGFVCFNHDLVFDFSLLIKGMLAQNIQSTLLDQIRIVNRNQKIVIWISSSLYVTVTVGNKEL